MSEKDVTKVPELSRRQLLTAAGMAGAGTAVTSLLTGTSSAKTNYWDLVVDNGDTWTKTDTAKVSNQYDISRDVSLLMSTSVKTFGGCPSDDSDYWSMHFETDMHGSSMLHDYRQDPGSGEDIDKIGYQSASVADTGGSSDTAAIAFLKDRDFTGGYPSEESESGAIGDAADLVIDETISAVNGTWGLALDAGTIALQLIYDALVTSDENPDSFEITRDYEGGYTTSNRHSQVNNYMGWDYKVEWGTTDTFYYEPVIATGSDFATDLRINTQIEVQAPYSDSCSGGQYSVSQTGSQMGFDSSQPKDAGGQPPDNAPCHAGKPEWAGDVSKAPPGFKRKYGLQKVPLKILERVGYDPSEIQTDGEMGWWASNVPTTVTTTITKSAENPR